MLAILPLQDWLSVDGAVRYPGDPKDERINVPAIPRYYWRYRMHLPLDGKDGLLSRESLSARIRGILADSARGI
jgi:4-alpha-glucanotransferase